MTNLSINQCNLFWEMINLTGTTYTMETIFVQKFFEENPHVCLYMQPFLNVFTRTHRGFMEWVCNFSAEEAVIREVWMREKVCLGGRGKMSGGKRTNRVVISSCSISDFLPGPGRNEWLWFVVIYIMLTWNYSLFFFFFFNRNVLVGPQLSMWQLHQREPELSLYPDLCQMLISTANLFLIKFFSIIFPFKFLIIKKNAGCELLKSFHHCVLQTFELNQCWQWKEIIILNNK